MSISKRNFLKTAGIGGVAAMAGAMSAPVRATETLGSSSAHLPSMIGDVSPISVDERLSRIAKAQRLMAEHGIDAMLVESGSAMLYFTGISWWRSERLTAVIIPREGEIGVVTPHFEEPSVRESLTFGDDVRPWHEHESPFERAAQILADRGLSGGKLAMEETVRYFIVDGMKAAAPGFEIVSATPVTLGCRMYKSPTELALMQKANDITMAAYNYAYPRIEVGMTPSDIGGLMREAMSAFGGSDIWTLILLNESSAYPHGSGQPQVVQEGGVVLMDCGCAVEGYQSDISRTFVYGEVTARQRQVWDLVKAGQELAMETAQIGTPAGRVDDVVRALYESHGFGPGYATPGTPHRLGHGIGMDGHESVNFVHGETMPLAPGMCFSNEPGIYSYGEFGIRLEDCLYMTDDGPQLFTALSPSIDKPFG